MVSPLCGCSKGIFRNVVVGQFGCHPEQASFAQRGIPGGPIRAGARKAASLFKLTHYPQCFNAWCSRFASFFWTLTWVLKNSYGAKYPEMSKINCVNCDA